MILPIDPASLPGPAAKILAPEANPKLRMLAARGIVPGLRPDALLSVMICLADGAPGEVQQQADNSLGKLPEPLLRGALSADLHARVIHELVRRYVDDLDIIATLLRKPQIDLLSVEHLAEFGGEGVTELVATNQERLLAHPRLIELLYLNAGTRMSTSDRLIELAVRHELALDGLAAFREMATAIQGELIPEPSDEPLPDDELYRATEELAAKLDDDTQEDAYVEDDTGEEKLEDRFVPLYMQLADMPMSQKIRRAMLGTKAERMMLVRERNKVVAVAAARSPLMREAEMALVARNRGVSEEVLRVIATSPEWSRSYMIKRNLVFNSKTPIALAQKMVVQLQIHDLRALAKSKNVSSAVQMQARRHLQRRKH